MSEKTGYGPPVVVIQGCDCVTCRARRAILQQAVDANVVKIDAEIMGEIAKPQTLILMPNKRQAGP